MFDTGPLELSLGLAKTEMNQMSHEVRAPELSSLESLSLEGIRLLALDIDHTILLPEGRDDIGCPEWWVQANREMGRTGALVYWRSRLPELRFRFTEGLADLLDRCDTNNVSVLLITAREPCLATITKDQLAPILPRLSRVHWEEGFSDHGIFFAGQGGKVGALQAAIAGTGASQATTLFVDDSHEQVSTVARSLPDVRVHIAKFL